MAKTPMDEEIRGGRYRLVRKGKLPWTVFHDRLWGSENRYEGVADFISLTEFYGPELIQTGMPIFTAIPGHKDIPPELGVLHILHGITPETPTSTHYFGFSTRNFRLDDAALDEFQLESDRHIRKQDSDAIEAVERRIDVATKAQRELLARSDGPAIKVRQRIQDVLDAES
jgi:hypothetical protein